jgi:hypothetical protein
MGNVESCPSLKRDFAVYIIIRFCSRVHIDRGLGPFGHMEFIALIGFDVIPDLLEKTA